MVKPFSYNKQEKLKSRKQLDALFQNGRSFSVFPVKVFYSSDAAQSEGAVKAGVGVSARHFKKAVQRNRIKRLLRECYRVQKQDLYEFAAVKERQVSVFFLYIDKVLPDFELLQQKMPLIIKRLIKEFNESLPAHT